MQVLEADHVVVGALAPVISSGAVAIDGGRILAAGSIDDLRQAYPHAERWEFPNAALMPGFVNAHQHGRGLSQVQLGYPDDALEPWIANRRRRGAPDSYALTKLAAFEMIANGVTAALHANYSYGSGDYEAELRGSIRAYEETGLRVTVCIGYADRGAVIYPPRQEEHFVAGLTAPTRDYLKGSAKPAYLPSVADTITLMERLQRDYAGHPTLSFAYGPAGPQWVSDGAWKALAADAVKRGVGLHFHLLESAAQAASIKALYPGGVLPHFEQLGVFSAPASCAHFVHASSADMDAACRVGLVVVSNPGSNLRLFNGAPPLASLLRAGIEVALGTDNFSLNDDEDYLRELRLGGVLARETGVAANRRNSRDLLRMATTAGARAAFLNDVGSLEAGASADVIAVDLQRIRGAWLDPDTDLLDAIMSRGSGQDVVLTMVAGRMLYHRGQFLCGDYRLAAEQAAASALSARSAGDRALSATEELKAALRHTYAQDRWP
jgi:5-methylthioadenosine/S-adenosylhomocysteine deaminase